MLCHLPFLLPLAGLIVFAILPLPEALTLYVPLALLSLAIGVPALRAMYHPVLTGSEGMRGKEGVVVAGDGRTGIVRCEGELWNYRSPLPLAPGDRVRIVAIEGLMAVVEPTAPAAKGVAR